MQKIDIIVVGKTKEGWLQRAEDEYVKRLRGDVALGIRVVRDESVKKWKSPDIIKKIEGERIAKLLGRASFNIALDLRGQDFSSVEFALLLKEKQEQGRPVAFIIGGALGLSEEVTQKAELVISISKLTFTHQMVRLILLEQLYRAHTILAGKEYHR
ncbi:MAG: 23S rRNA (pseudouridine(1915)-N(3))-methyltransferase RlmH [Nitrospinota bacterium]